MFDDIITIRTRETRSKIEMMSSLTTAAMRISGEGVGLGCPGAVGGGWVAAWRPRGWAA
jgi:hypothetical protein